VRFLGILFCESSGRIIGDSLGNGVSKFFAEVELPRSAIDAFASAAHAI
jgi:hypothetical protein